MSVSQLLAGHRSITCLWHVQNLSDIDLSLDDETLVRVRTDSLCVGCLRCYCKVDSSSATAPRARFEVAFEDQLCNLWARLVVQSHDVATPTAIWRRRWSRW